MGKTIAVKKRSAKKTTGPLKLSTRVVRGIVELKPMVGHKVATLSIPKFSTMVKSSRVGLPVWSNALHVSATSLEKRIESKAAFTPLEADRLLMVDQVLDRGMEVFEDAEDLKIWLERKHPLFGNQRPMDLLGSTPGIGLVMMELGRIEHGIF